MRPCVRATLVGMSVGLLLFSAGRASAVDRSADEISKDLDEAKLPVFDKTKLGDEAYGREFTTRREEVIEKRAALILVFYKAAPEHEKVPSLMFERWDTLITLGKDSDVRQEILDTLANTKNPKLKLEAAYERARLEIRDIKKVGSIDVKMIDQYIKLEQQLKPADKRSALLLMSATTAVKTEKARAMLESRILKEFPDSIQASNLRGAHRQGTSVGRPFNLEFNDAIKGSYVSMQQLRGKIVVIDFWASWCGPCIQELPKMKELYAKYRSSGVEFIGVSLDYPVDRGGLEALKKCVAERGIPWPQYYQGRADAEFSMSWGVHAIPTVFVIDPVGNLHSTQARGQLETIIPQLIEAREQGAFYQPVYRPKRKSKKAQKSE